MSGDLLGLLLFLLALGGGVQHLLHEKELIAVDRFRVVAAHRRHEERHRGDDADVEEEREADAEPSTLALAAVVISVGAARARRRD